MRGCKQGAQWGAGREKEAKGALDSSERFDWVTNMWGKLAGNKKPGFSNSTYLSKVI